MPSKLWSDCADAQSDQSLLGHKSDGSLSHFVVHIIYISHKRTNLSTFTWYGLFGWVRFNGPVNNIKVMLSLSVYLTTLFLGRLSPLLKWLTSFVHSQFPESEKRPSWIRGRERMTVENISWSRKKYPVNTIKVMSSQSFYLTTFFQGRLRFLSSLPVLVHSHLPENDNCPSWMNVIGPGGDQTRDLLITSLTHIRLSHQGRHWIKVFNAFWPICA